MVLIDFCKQKLPIIFSLFLLFALSGCIGVRQDVAGVHNNGAGGEGLLPLDVNDFVTGMPAGSVAVFPQTPWGDQLEVELSHQYFAASGRSCRALILRSTSTSSEREQRALVCQFELGQWQSVRPVTRVLK